MMTERDHEEEEKTDGVIKGGASLATVLALRHVREAVFLPPLQAEQPSELQWPATENCHSKSFSFVNDEDRAVGG